MTLGEMPTTAWRLPYWPQLSSAFGRARRCCIRTSEKFPWRMFRLCEVALLGHYPRSARHGSTVRKVFHLGVHVSERNAVVTFKEFDAAWREKMALRKPELSERYVEVEEAIVT